MFKVDQMRSRLGVWACASRPQLSASASGVDRANEVEVGAGSGGGEKKKAYLELRLLS